MAVLGLTRLIVEVFWIADLDWSAKAVNRGLVLDGKSDRCVERRDRGEFLALRAIPRQHLEQPGTVFDTPADALS